MTTRRYNSFSSYIYERSTFLSLPPPLPRSVPRFSSRGLLTPPIMRSKDFIAAVVSGRRTEPGSCSSIYFDGEHLYSYGLHYPLLVNIGGRWILNNSGYSMTTAKHIGWASAFADYRFPFPRGMNLYPSEMLQRVTEKIIELQTDLPKLRKNAFLKRESMTRDIMEYAHLKDWLTSQAS